MKIQLKNLGPVYDYTFDTEKDFHIIYGENTIGKSFAMSVVYITLKHFINQENDFDNHLLKYLLAKPENENVTKIIQSTQEKIDENKMRTFSIARSLENALKKDIFDKYIARIQQSFVNSFSNLANLQNKISKEELEIIVTLKDFEFVIRQQAKNELYILNLTLNKSPLVRFAKQDEPVEILKDEVYFCVNKLNFDTQKLRKEVLSYIFDAAKNSISHFKNTISDIYYFPASRSGLYQAMNSWTHLFAKLSQLKYLINDKIEIPDLAETLSDYFLTLSSLNPDKKNDIYSELAKEIENAMLGGEVIYNQQTQKLNFAENNTKLKLDIVDTSSMVSELAPIVAYFKFIATEKPLNNITLPKRIIFIEEPEAHLHPEVQTKLTHIFVKMLKYNIKVVITTHSDFIFNKLTNLILSKELDHNKISSTHLVSTDKGSIDAQDMKATAQGIDDHNFISTAEKLYEERVNFSNI